MSENTNIAKNAIIIYIRLAITALVGLLSSRFVIRALGASDFGLYNVVGSIVTMMAFVNIVMVTTTYRYVAYEIGKGVAGSVNKVFNTSLMIHFIIALIVFILSATLGELYINNYLKVDPSKIGDAEFVFWTAIGSCMISIVSVPYTGLLTAYEKFSVMAVVEIIHRLIVLVASISLMFFLGNRLRLYGICVGGFNALSSLSYIVFCHIKYHSQIAFHFQKDRGLYKKMAGYSGWIALGAASSIGQTQGAAIIVNHFFGTILNAAYGIANTIYNMVSQFSRAISQAAAPQITKNYSGRNEQRSVELASYISKYTVFFMLFFAVPIIVETDFILDLWLGKDAVPPYSSVMVKLMLINLTIGGMGEGIATLIQATGKIKIFQIIGSFITLSSLPIACFLYANNAEPYVIIICFIIGAAINLSVRPYLLYKLIHFDVRRLLDISYFKIIYVVLCIVPMYCLVQLFDDSWMRFLIVIPLSMIYLLAVIWLVGTDKNERNRFVEFIKRKRLKFK